MLGDAVIQGWGNNNPQTLAYFEENHPQSFGDNRQVDPLFSNATAYDFTLTSLSPMRDEGLFLSRTTGSGSGTTLQVEDSRYFHNGFTIIGVEGDVIQLEGQSETARVVKVNYETHTLTLSNALTWSNNLGISLAYTGDAPDIGAHEYTGDQPPHAPTDLIISNR